MTPTLRSALDALGVRLPRPPRQPDAPVWRPTYPGEEPPF